MIPIEELRDLSNYTTERLEHERLDSMLALGSIKQKLLKLPRGDDNTRLLSAKMAYTTVYQVTSNELGSRRRQKRAERANAVERCFVELAKERLPEDVFQDILDEAVDKTREK